MAAIIYGPHGSGKTANAERLAALFGATAIIEEWTADQPLPGCALVLTNAAPPRPPSPGDSVIYIGDAMRLLEIDQVRALRQPSAETHTHQAVPSEAAPVRPAFLYMRPYRYCSGQEGTHCRTEK